MNDLSYLLAAQAPPLMDTHQAGPAQRASEKSGASFAELLKVRSRPYESIPEYSKPQPASEATEKNQKANASKSKVQEDQQPFEAHGKGSQDQDDDLKPDEEALAQSPVPTAPAIVSQTGTQTQAEVENATTSKTETAGAQVQTQNAAGPTGSTGNSAGLSGGNLTVVAAETVLEAGMIAEPNAGTDTARKPIDPVETAPEAENAKSSTTKPQGAFQLKGFEQVLDAAQTLSTQTPNQGVGEAFAAKLSQEPTVNLTNGSESSVQKMGLQAVLQNQEQIPEQPGQSTISTQIPTIPMTAEYRGDRSVIESTPIGLARMAEARSAEVIKQVTSAMDTLAKTGQHTLRLQLSPDDLGRIDLRMTTGQNGLNVVITADQASTGRMIASEINQLRQSLQDAGVHLAQVSVGQNGSQGQTDQGRQQARGKTNRAHNLQSVSIQNGDGPDQLARAAQNRTLVDYQV